MGKGLICGVVRGSVVGSVERFRVEGVSVIVSVRIGVRIRLRVGIILKVGVRVSGKVGVNISIRVGVKGWVRMKVWVGVVWEVRVFLS